MACKMSCVLPILCGAKNRMSLKYSYSINLTRRFVTKYPFETNPVKEGLELWHCALAATNPPRHLLLPKGHPDGSQSCEIQALLGDSFIKTAVLRELGVMVYSKSRDLQEGEITSKLSQAISNSVFSQAAVDILVTPGVDISAEDIEILPTHGRGTAVESAVAMVYEREGELPIQSLAKELILRSSQLHNWKGYLLQMGGEVAGFPKKGGFSAVAKINGSSMKSSTWPTKLSAEQDAAERVCRSAGLLPDNGRNVSSPSLIPFEEDGYNWKGALLELNGSVDSFPCTGKNQGFFAEAKLNNYISKSKEFSSKKKAEQAASRAVLLESRLVTPDDRAAFKLEEAKAAMSMSARLKETLKEESEWFNSSKNLTFEELNVNPAIFNSGAKDAEWFLKYAVKPSNAFSVFKLSPVALPEHVESALAWGTTLDETKKACVAIAVLTLKGKSKETRWFVSDAHPSMTKARNHVAVRALNELRLIDEAEKIINRTD